jgi:hypothetical protein
MENPWNLSTKHLHLNPSEFRGRTPEPPHRFGTKGRSGARRCAIDFSVRPEIIHLIASRLGPGVVPLLPCLQNCLGTQSHIDFGARNARGTGCPG